MRKIIFYLLLFFLLFLFPSPGAAWSQTFETHPQDNNNYTKSSGSIVANNGGYSLKTSHVASISINGSYDGYLSYTIAPASGSGWYKLGLYMYDSTGATVFSKSDWKVGYPTVPTGKVEFIENGAGTAITMYFNGVAEGTTSYSSSNEVSKITLQLTYENSNMYIDDITTDSCIGTSPSWDESNDNIYFTWSEQLARSYPDSEHMITLYSLQNTNNIGAVTNWTLPGGDTGGLNESGYVQFSRSNILGLNYGLYLLELTKDSNVLEDRYFYYDQLANPIGYPEMLFLAGADVNAEILDEDLNGGEISGGETIYLYPDTNANGYYDISYEILETPYSIEADLNKIYTSSTLNGTNLSFTGLSGQNYYVSVDGTAINGTNGSNTWSYSLAWDEENDSHTISFAPDYTLPGVWGYIKNEETQAVLKSATVTVSNGTFSETIYTDTNGMYYLTHGITEGTYTITAAKTGYTTSSAFTVTTATGTTTRKDIFLAESSGAGVYYASHDVTFTVLEYWYSSAGLPGVTYAVYDNENESVKNGTTGSKGTFTVKDMDAGKNYTFILTYNNQTYTEYLEPGLTEYNLILNKEGIVHQYYNSWLNLTYAENSNNATILYASNKTVSAASLSVTASNGTIVQSGTLNTTSGTFLFNFTDGDYILQFDIEASDGSTASQAWSISSPPEVTLFPDSYPTWLKNTLFVAVIIIFLLAFGKSKNDIACGSVAVLTSLGYYFEWLSCGFNFVVLVWLIALGAIYLHYKRTGAVG